MLAPSPVGAGVPLHSKPGQPLAAGSLGTASRTAVGIGIPPATFQVEGAVGDQFAEFSGAFFAPGQGRVGHLLDRLLHFTAIGAFILINRHVDYLLVASKRSGSKALAFSLSVCTKEI